MKKPSRIKALILAVMVTIVWSTSWVLIKFGLEDIPAMTFAGLRYILASLLFLPILLQKKYRTQIKALTKKEWLTLILLGIILYTIGQGGQYFGLAYLPSVSVSLILNMGALFVAVVSSFTLKEKLNWLQWVGILLNLTGVLIYFGPKREMLGHWLGWFFAILCLLGNSIGSIIGREVNRKGTLHPIVITGISMLFGSILMLATGVIWQGLPVLSIQNIWIIVIMAVVNTTLAFTVWNYTQQTLHATETTILNNTMMVYVAILAWIFLDEKQTTLGILGLVLVLAGAILVQLRRRPRSVEET